MKPTLREKNRFRNENIPAAISLAGRPRDMLKEKGLNEEITIKLIRRDVLLLMLCMDVAHKQAKGGMILYDLENLREKLVTESKSAMYVVTQSP